MKKLYVVLSLLVLGLLSGCGVGGNNNGGGGGGGIHVGISPSGTTSVGVTLTQQFTASVSGTSNTAVNWSLSGSGCSGAACGTISSTGLYTAPAAPPSPATVTVTATSAADSTKSASANVSVVHITVSVVPTGATVALNGTQQFTALVSPQSPVTWSVSGTTCSGVACGTVDNVGIYTAPASLPSGNPPIVKVTATSTIDPAQIGSSNANVTLVSSFNSRLNGSYAFHFSGFDSTGAVYIAGAFQAHGNGLIDNGIEDVNRAGGVSTSVAFTGSYTLDSNNHGTITLGSSTYKVSLGAKGEATIVEMDSTGTRGAGVVDLATTPFTLGEISGPHVMGLFGTDASSQRVGAAGLFHADGLGGITVDALDINDAGTVPPTATLSGAYTVASNGRGTITVVDPLLNTFHYSFYIVTKDEIFLIATDAVDANHRRVNGLVFSQAPATYTNASFNGTSAFSLSGLNGTNSSVVAIGLVVTNGAGNLSSGSMYDANNAGTITSQQALSGSYAMDASGNGRGTVTLTGTAPAPNFVMYAVDTNKAFLLDVSTGSALSGTMEPQKAGQIGVFNAGTLQGTFVTGTTATANTSADNLAGVLTMDGISSVSGTEDRSTSSQNFAGETVSGSYTVASSGRGTMTLTSPAATSRVLYIVDNTRFVTIGVDAGNQAATVLTSAR